MRDPAIRGTAHWRDNLREDQYSFDGSPDLAQRSAENWANLVNFAVIFAVLAVLTASAVQLLDPPRCQSVERVQELVVVYD